MAKTHELRNLLYVSGAKLSIFLVSSDDRKWKTGDLDGQFYDEGVFWLLMSSAGDHVKYYSHKGVQCSLREKIRGDKAHIIDP